MEYITNKNLLPRHYCVSAHFCKQRASNLFSARIEHYSTLTIKKEAGISPRRIIKLRRIPREGYTPSKAPKGFPCTQKQRAKEFSAITQPTPIRNPARCLCLSAANATFARIYIIARLSCYRNAYRHKAQNFPYITLISKSIFRFVPLGFVLLE